MLETRVTSRMEDSTDGVQSTEERPPEPRTELLRSFLRWIRAPRLSAGGEYPGFPELNSVKAKESDPYLKVPAFVNLR